MGINGIGTTYYPAGYETRRVQKEATGSGFSNQINDTAAPETDSGITKSNADVNQLFDMLGNCFRPESVNNSVANEKSQEIDFGRFAPNAPDEVKQAFMESASETGYYEYNGHEMMKHISQILVRQVENRMNGIENPQDVFGSTVASALQAARQMLYDLENPLVPHSQRGENVARYIEQEKEFYRTFIKRLEGLKRE